MLRALKSLYIQVLIGIALGILVGWVWPDVGKGLEPLGVGFVKLIRMLIAPIIFCTVAGAIARSSDIRRLGRIGGKALIYFEVMSTFALALGLVVGELVQPGAGFNVDPHTLDPKAVADYAAKAQQLGTPVEIIISMIAHIIPGTFFGALADGDILQVLLVAILTGFAVARLQGPAAPVTGALDRLGEVFFGIIRIVVRAAPVGAFGGMAFTVGKYGPAALIKLAGLVGCFYLTSILFVLVVLGAVGLLVGFSIFRLISYLREELLIVLGASSSEAALPQLMAKLQTLGAPAQVTGLVVPAGYSFNLDGTNIYMTLASLFLAQATNTHLTLVQLATLLGVAMLTSKGASGVTGAGFITLAATLQVVPSIPVAAMVLVIGVDRFMSECRALTNVVGNAVAALVIARWEGVLDRQALAAGLKAGPAAHQVEAPA